MSPSVTWLGIFFHFGQLYKASGNNYFGQIAHILSNFCKGVKIFHFLVKSFLGNFYRPLATFYWSRWRWPWEQNTVKTPLRRWPDVGRIIKPSRPQKEGSLIQALLGINPGSVWVVTCGLSSSLVEENQLKMSEKIWLLKYRIDASRHQKTLFNKNIVKTRLGRFSIAAKLWQSWSLAQVGQINTEKLPNCIKIVKPGSKVFQILNKPSKMAKGLYNFFKVSKF